MTETRFGDGWVRLREGFVPDHAALMETLRATLPLRAETLVLFGREVTTPRLTSWHGDPGCVYRYSGRRFAPAPWTDALAALRARLREACGVDFNSVLANYYRDGADSMGAHADDEPELGPSPADVRIASISLGARRRFLLRPRAGGASIPYSLGEGSLLEMGGTLQRTHTHRVPKTKREVGPRLNLTFRVIRISPTTAPCSS
ncbi:MAG: alpha-ketoglutarate-dependent dioxygenase AlkB [Sandaracinaceae bacterium]